MALGTDRHRALGTRSAATTFGPLAIRHYAGNRALDSDAHEVGIPAAPDVASERSGLVVGSLRVEEFEGTFADLPWPITFMLNVATRRCDVVVADEASDVFEVERA